VILAQRVRSRVRRGLFRAYQPDVDRLPYIRGRLDIARTVTSPWRVDLACRFEEHTADVEDNRLLLWALHLALRIGICGEHSSRHIRDAHRSLIGCVALTEQPAELYARRRYQRLNEDYEPMHALARFIVQHASPRHAHGEHSMVPFVVDMNRLYERFVATWLRLHLPAEWTLDAQDRCSFGSGAVVEFHADLVIRERETGTPLLVLDTKYKRDVTPSSDDLAQVVAYATAWGTDEAILIYPTWAAEPWTARVGHVRVRALAFALSGNLDEGGRRFLDQLRTLVNK
jgi:5-methylcytosine-specific restriction enzyme subunit McrC